MTECFWFSRSHWRNGNLSERDNTPVCGWWFDSVNHFSSGYSILFQDFLAIRKRKLQNYEKIFKKCIVSLIRGSFKFLTIHQHWNFHFVTSTISAFIAKYYVFVAISMVYIFYTLIRYIKLIYNNWTIGGINQIMRSSVLKILPNAITSYYRERTHFYENVNQLSSLHKELL